MWYKGVGTCTFTVCVMVAPHDEPRADDPHVPPASA